MKSWLSVLIMASFLAACADTHQLIRENTSSGIRLNPNDTIVIAVPEDGFYGGDTYQGTGKHAAQIIYSAFAKYTQAAEVGHLTQGFNEALGLASKSGKKYLVYPTILHWEDRATEWSGIPDKVELKIEIISVATGKAISTAFVNGKSGLATFGGDHPQDLLSDPVEEFVSTLY
jgi:Domain of unknown function (DUF4823)